MFNYSMFHFPLGFIYVLYILIKSSTSVLVSFDESCSDSSPCIDPLVCSNTSKCVCSDPSSFWNNEGNDCLSCPTGWIEWKTSRCLSFAVPSEGGFSYDRANNVCQSFSAQLLHIHNQDMFKQLVMGMNTLLQSTFSSAATIFFRLGAWINVYDNQGLEDVWCDQNEYDSSFECVYISRKISKNNSLCLSRLKCNEEMLFICDMAAVSEKSDENSISSNHRAVALLGALAPMAFDLIGNLFGGNKKKPETQTQTGPQPIIIQQESGLAAQLAAQNAASDNTLLYVGLGIGGFILILVIIGACLAVVYFMKSSSSTRRTNNRSSVESGISYA